jgi:formylmethanofuran dehydrogenase subunit C
VTLTLTLRAAPPAHVDASVLTPARLDGLAEREVASLTLRCGRESLPVGDLFAVSGRGDGDLHLIGDLRLIDAIGHMTTHGRIVVDGPCGDHVGAKGKGGEIVVRGDAGRSAGAELRAGRITIQGNAGDRLGAAYPGARAGVTGGEIVVTGDAGAEAGAGMRRGLVAIGGRAGAGAGLRMLAGTVIALGGVGPEAGMGNRRGSIASGAPATLLASYAFATRLRPPALALQLRHLRTLGLPVDDARLAGRWARWSGDGLELNRGEILIFDEEDGA